MDKIYLKYLNSSISPEELKELRSRIENNGDEELEVALFESWTDINSQSDECFKKHHSDELFKHITKSNKGRKMTLRRVVNMSLRIASVLVIAVLLGSTVHYYNQVNNLMNGDVVIKVGVGESVALSLPDGTSLNLNSESVLRYNPVTFNKDQRKLYFEGEGYFDVASNSDAPFVVTTANMNLKVMGTKFNLRSYNHLDNIEVALIEGHVILSSQDSSSNQTLFANQKAIFSKSNNIFALIPEFETKQAVAWINKELVFASAKMRHVLNALESNYGVNITTINCNNALLEKFTGTLPSNNIEEVMLILQKILNVSYTRVDKKIILESNR